MTDTTKWEYMLAGGDRNSLDIPDLDDEDDLDDLDDDGQEKEEDKCLDMPTSWVLPIEITKKEYETRCDRVSNDVMHAIYVVSTL